MNAKKNLLVVLIIAFVLSSSSFAQIGGLKNLKDKINKNKKDKSTTSSTITTPEKKMDDYLKKADAEYEKKNYENAINLYEKARDAATDGGDKVAINQKIKQCKEAMNTEKAGGGNLDALAGKTAFMTKYGDSNYKNSCNIGDDLFARFVLKKTMVEYHSELGINETFNAYGFVVITIDGVQRAISGPMQFTSNYSKVWKYVVVPLNLDAVAFSQGAKSDPSILSTSQGVWMFTYINADVSPRKDYINAAIQYMKKSSHKVKIEFGLGGKSDKKPKGIVASGEITVNVDEAGLNKLYERGPKHLRPLKPEEAGKFTANNANFNLGSNDLSLTLSMPNPPKYYNMKWCQSMSCDYDHGEMVFYAELDGKFLASWQTTFWNADYEQKKSFAFIAIPKSDAGIEDVASNIHSATMFNKQDNVLALAFLDNIYGGKIQAGKHNLKITAYSIESFPTNSSFENSSDYYSSIPSIAENSFDFNITQSGIQKIKSTCTVKKPTHAGGSWTTVDNYLKAHSNESGIKMIDVATKTQWKVYKNSLGVILYRTCKADVLYNHSEYGCRVMRGVKVKEDYSGGGSYSNPYFDGANFNLPPFMLSTWNVPIPCK